MAIGATTRKALSRIGICAEVPEKASSEGVVASVTTTLKAGSTVLIICGEEGMTLLRERLAKLGYKVCVWCVYRRVIRSKKPLLKRDCGVVELSSVTSLQAYWQAVRRHALISTEEPLLVVPSRRIGKHGRLLGFERIHVASDASAQAFVEVIRRVIRGDYQ
jgi:uroporphyrinogen-III synthase